MAEHQDAFIQTLRAGREMRNCVFHTLEQRHAHDFRNGTAGIRYYEYLLTIVREAGVAEAVEEFQSRFFPLLNQDPPPGGTGFGPPKEMTNRDRIIPAEDRRGGRWGWIAALGAAVILGAVIFGFNALKTTTAKPPAVTAAPSSAAGIPAPAPETTTREEPAPATPTEQDPR